MRSKPAAATATLTLLVVSFGLTAAPASAGGGCHREPAEAVTESFGSTVELAGACMNPAVLRVDPGTAVTFVNRDELQHNLYGAGFAAGDLPPGAQATFRFDNAGTYAYACTLHPGMVGSIAVGDGRGATGAPVQVESVTTTTATPVPVAVTRPAPLPSGDGDGVPVSLALAGGAVAAALAFGAGVRRRGAVKSI